MSENLDDIIKWMNLHNKADGYFKWNIKSLNSLIQHDLKKWKEVRTGGFRFSKTKSGNVHIIIENRGKLLKNKLLEG
jgi:hypothetical protein